MPPFKSARSRIEVKLETGRTKSATSSRSTDTPLSEMVGMVINRSRAPRTLLHRRRIQFGDGQCLNPRHPDFAHAMGHSAEMSRRQLGKARTRIRIMAMVTLTGIQAGSSIATMNLWIRRNDDAPDGPMPETIRRSLRSRSLRTAITAQFISAVKQTVRSGSKSAVWNTKSDFSGNVPPGSSWTSDHSARGYVNMQNAEILNTFAHAGAFSVAASVLNSSSQPRFVEKWPVESLNKLREMVAIPKVSIPRRGRF